MHRQNDGQNTTGCASRSSTSTCAVIVTLRMPLAPVREVGTLGVKVPRHDPHVGAIPTRLTAFLQNALPDVSLLPLDYR